MAPLLEKSYANLYVKYVAVKKICAVFFRSKKLQNKPLFRAEKKSFKAAPSGLSLPLDV